MDDVFNVSVKWTHGVTADFLGVESWLHFPTLSQIVLCASAICGKFLISVVGQIIWRAKSNVLANGG